MITSWTFPPDIGQRHRPGHSVHAPRHASLINNHVTGVPRSPQVSPGLPRSPPGRPHGRPTRRRTGAFRVSEALVSLRSARNQLLGRARPGNDRVMVYMCWCTLMYIYSRIYIVCECVCVLLWVCAQLSIYVHIDPAIGIHTYIYKHIAPFSIMAILGSATTLTCLVFLQPRVH